MWWDDPPDKRRPEGWGLLKSFGCALRGVGLCLLRERNLRIHLCIFAAVLWLAAALELPWEDWARLLLASGLVFAAEHFNSALETLEDVMTGECREFARSAKDMAAGAVLAASLFAAAVGVLVLWRPASLLALGRRVLGDPGPRGRLSLAHGRASRPRARLPGRPPQT